MKDAGQIGCWTSHALPDAAVALEQVLHSLSSTLADLCLARITPGSRHTVPAGITYGIGYIVQGFAKLDLNTACRAPLAARTLIIVPPGQAMSIVSDRREDEEEEDVTVFCGRFSATYAGAMDIFASRNRPYVEQFGVAEDLTDKFQLATGELMGAGIGKRAIADALLTQVLVLAVRKALNSPDRYDEQLALLRDPKLARALAVMISKPGARHTIESLALVAGMSRSAFMVRFNNTFGCTPMQALRKIRMHQAAKLLRVGKLSTEQVAAVAGYASRSSFMRAWQSVQAVPSR